MSRKKILVVDNNIVLLKLMTSFLVGEGHEVREAENGFEAIAVLTSFSPDIIYIDLVMPKIGGASLCRIIRNMPRFSLCYLVIVSAIALEQQPDLATIGADACIAKGPFKKMSGHLLETIHESDLPKRRDAGFVIKGAETLFPRQISHELLAQNQHILEILNGVSQGILEVDSNHVLYANSAALKLLKLPSEKVYGFSLDQVLEPRIWSSVNVAMEACKKGEAVNQSPIKIFDKYIILQCQASLSDSSFILMLTDITEREIAETNARISCARIETIFTSVSDAIFVHPFQEEGFKNFIEVNDFACRHYGYSRDELLELTAKDITVMSEYSSHARANHRKKLLEQGRMVFESVHVKKSGETFPVEISSNITEQSGRPVILAVVRDITERKNAIREKEALEAQLYQAQKMDAVGRLAGGVAHDFNNMLSVILGFTELSLRELQPDQGLFKNLQKIQKAAKHSSELTGQLLAFARKQTVSPKVIDLNVALNKMMAMLRRLIGEDVFLECIPNENIWPIMMDTAQIDQIVVNLCINARAAISENGHISLKTGNITIDEKFCLTRPGFLPGNYVALDVTDNGCGMESEILQLIFEPFFTTKKQGEGTGLGLATVYGILKQNGGFIDVTSQPKIGTTFSIFFPRHFGELLGEEEEKKNIIVSGNETVLLVEDESTILDMLKIMLKKMGYKVLAANSPDKALGIAEKSDVVIDLVITDVVMPGMNGIELEKKLKEFYPNLKCLFISGYTPNVIAHHGVLDSDIQFIQKPFSQEALSDKIRSVLAL